ncbi:hypothetical protein [Serratia entomophila]|uniref:hypothetical protein n=1 Tax=Serratia entomophila TaxID=42906 RepID=UPI00217C5633|nr:hypothetical protein [Serratia entomophila]CAI1561388.1 Uncharacterised protein [Serratia entomophila]
MAENKEISVAALKNAFKEGATPNEQDYHTLIDLAAVGSKALGADDTNPTTPTLGLGLVMTKDKLAVKQGTGVLVSVDGIEVKGDGKSVKVTADGVGIKVKANGGLESNTDGLYVKAGQGLKTDKNGLEIKLAEKSGLTANKDGLAVCVAAGLEIDNNGALKVKVKAGGSNYIENTSGGLAITKSGVEEIKTALKQVSLDALDKAVQGTSQGYKLDSNNPAAGDVEAKIAEKLNEAYAEGWHLTQPRAALFAALLQFRRANKDKFVNTATIAPSSAAGETGLYDVKKVAFTTDQIAVTKITAAGAVDQKSAWPAEGIFALVGKVNDKGDPESTGGHYTRHALMVTVAGGVRTVVGRWDFLADESTWGGANVTGGWSAAVVHDKTLSNEAKRVERALIENKERRLWESTAHNLGYISGEAEGKREMDNAVNTAKASGIAEGKKAMDEAIRNARATAYAEGEAKGRKAVIDKTLNPPLVTVGSNACRTEVGCVDGDWIITVQVPVASIVTGPSSNRNSGYHFVIPEFRYDIAGNTDGIATTEYEKLSVEGQKITMSTRVDDHLAEVETVTELGAWYNDTHHCIHFYAKTPSLKSGIRKEYRPVKFGRTPYTLHFDRPKEKKTGGFAKLIVRLIA